MQAPINLTQNACPSNSLYKKKITPIPYGVGNIMIYILVYIRIRLKKND